LGLPCDLLVRGFQLNIFLTVLVSGILCTWPNQLSLWALMWLITFLCFISLSNSSLVLTLHIWFSFVGPNILHTHTHTHTQKRRFVLVHAMKACRGGRVSAPVILNLGTRYRWVVNFTPQPLFTRKEPQYPLKRRLGGPQNWSGLGIMKIGRVSQTQLTNILLLRSSIHLAYLRNNYMFRPFF
jgi:hypothetical protein